jgi:hypothetical protein
MNYQDQERIKIKVYIEFEELHESDGLRAANPLEYSRLEMEYVERRYREIIYNIKKD